MSNMKMPLLYDFTRCYGDGCPEKDSCMRYLTMRVDPVQLFSYVLTLRGHSPNETCESKLDGDVSTQHTV
jgi:hypothetical protein